MCQITEHPFALAQQILNVLLVQVVPQLIMNQQYVKLEEW